MIKNEGNKILFYYYSWRGGGACRNHNVNRVQIRIPSNINNAGNFFFLNLIPGIFFRFMGQNMHQRHETVYQEMPVYLLDDGCTKPTPVLPNRSFWRAAGYRPVQVLCYRRTLCWICGLARAAVTQEGTGTVQRCSRGQEVQVKTKEIHVNIDPVWYDEESKRLVERLPEGVIVRINSLRPLVYAYSS